MKILIADDEKLVRYSLTSMLEEIGIKGKDILISVNGADFIDKLKKDSPDIAFVDIKMPKLNGIEAIRQSKKISPHTQYYILTCYPVFDYAQQAIDIGISGYLLKPVSTNELNSIIKKYKNLKKIQNKAANRQFENYINALYNNTVSIENTEAAYIRDLQFYAITVIFDSCMNEAEKAKIQVRFCESIRRDIESLLDNSVHFGFLTLENGNLNAVTAWNSSAEKNEIENKQRIILKKFVSLAGEVKGEELTATIFVLPVLSGFLLFSDKLNELNTLSVLRIPFGLGEIHYFNDLLAAKNKKPLLMELSVITANLAECYLNGLYLKYLEKLRDLEHLVTRHISIFDLSSIETISDYLKYSIGLPKNNYSKPSVFINSLEEFGAKLLYRDSNKGKLPGNIIGQVKEYIEENYMKNIGIAQIAYNLKVTPNYLSMLFHKKTGKTFVEYITEVRMEKAEKLLSGPQIKISEVSKMVGYYSPRYFSRLFKKKYGCYPSEYSNKSAKFHGLAREASKGLNNRI